ncbi:MAG: TIGR02594 family protein [Agrobacterium cavarae]
MTTQTFGEWAIAKLRDAGAYGGAYDGTEGRRYIEALERFQHNQGLKVTGRADEETVARLRLVPKLRADGSSPDHSIATIPPKIVEPVWMRDARRYLGVKEIPGEKSNAVIIGWAKALGGWIANWFKNDDTPWCGLFVSNAIATTLPKESMPANPLGALNWAKFGQESRAARGAILVFERAGGGHVGFYVGEDSEYFHVLGGNQDNAVSITRVKKGRLVTGGIRWPKTGEAPIGGAVYLDASGAPLSKSEA